MYMLMAVMALVLVVRTWWAMRVRQMQGGAAGHVKAAAFALFQLAVMAALIAADAWRRATWFWKPSPSVIRPAGWVLGGRGRRRLRHPAARNRAGRFRACASSFPDLVR